MIEPTSQHGTLLAFNFKCSELGYGRYRIHKKATTREPISGTDAENVTLSYSATKWLSFCDDTGVAIPGSLDLSLSYFDLVNSLGLALPCPFRPSSWRRR
jgi:hypothetical protein